MEKLVRLQPLLLSTSQARQTQKLINKIILIVSILALFWVSTGVIDANYTAEYKPSLNQLVVRYSKVYGANPKEISAVIKCESSGDTKAWNKEDPGDGSKGVLQFQDSTFLYYAKEIGIENPDVWDTEQQVQTGAYMFSKKQSKQWSCAKIIGLIK